MDSLNNSFELLKFLHEKNLLKNSPKFWWPKNDNFEVIIGAILTQNTKWQNVEKSLKNLKDNNLLDLYSLAKIDVEKLSFLIKPSGFQNQKSNRIKLLCNNIINEFGNLENFEENVTRDWLLSQKGIGQESADAIMCYACSKDEMVVDKYTQKLVAKFGLEFKNYQELKYWVECGIKENYDKIISLYNYNISLNEVYCRFHGKIVEYMKKVK